MNDEVKELIRGLSSNPEAFRVFIRIGRQWGYKVRPGTGIVRADGSVCINLGPEADLDEGRKLALRIATEELGLEGKAN